MERLGPLTTTHERMNLFSQKELNRYQRQMLLPELGQEGQEKLKNARVLVVGAGGLGCPALQYLAAAGVGSIGIIDGDHVEESNLHRQLLFNHLDTGRNKATVAAEKLSLINPFISVQDYPFFLTAGNSKDLVSNYDLVIDGSDNFATRYLVNDTCVLTGKPFIYAALHRFELQLAAFNYKDGPTYRCLYPEPPGAGEMPSCSEAGIVGALPGLAGTLQALEAIKIITGAGQPLFGKLLLVNLLNNERTLMEIMPAPGNRDLKAITSVATGCGTENITEANARGRSGKYHRHTADCQAENVPEMEEAEEVEEIEAQQLLDWIARNRDQNQNRQQNPVQVIDVRSKVEFSSFRLDKNEINIPLDQLTEKLHLVRPDATVVTLCQSGIRSKKAARIMKAARPGQAVFSLKNGLNGMPSAR